MDTMIDSQYSLKQNKKMPQNKQTLDLTCINPTSTITRRNNYQGTPVRLGYHGWSTCSLSDATCFRITDDCGTRRYISKDRFRVNR